MPPQAPRRRRVSTAKRVVIACVCAVLMFCAVIGGLIFSGWRYQSIEIENGVTVKFLGVIKDDKPIKGQIVYSTGLTGVLDEETGIIKYNDGSRYYGELGEDFRKNGKGKLTFASGNIYDGEFRSDSMTGTASLTYANGDKYVGSFVDGKKTARARTPGQTAPFIRALSRMICATARVVTRMPTAQATWVITLWASRKAAEPTRGQTATST